MIVDTTVIEGPDTNGIVSDITVTAHQMQPTLGQCLGGLPNWFEPRFISSEVCDRVFGELCEVMNTAEGNNAVIWAHTFETRVIIHSFAATFGLASKKTLVIGWVSDGDVRKCRCGYVSYQWYGKLCDICERDIACPRCSRCSSEAMSYNKPNAVVVGMGSKEGFTYKTKHGHQVLELERRLPSGPLRAPNRTHRWFVLD